MTVVCVFTYQSHIWRFGELPAYQRVWSILCQFSLWNLYFLCNWRGLFIGKLSSFLYAMFSWSVIIYKESLNVMQIRTVWRTLGKKVACKTYVKWLILIQLWPSSLYPCTAMRICGEWTLSVGGERCTFSDKLSVCYLLDKILQTRSLFSLSSKAENGKSMTKL